MRNLLYVLLAFVVVLLVYGVLLTKAFGQNIPQFNEHPAHATEVTLPSGGGTTEGRGEGHAQIPTPPQESLGDAVKRLHLKPKHTPLECQNVVSRSCK